MNFAHKIILALSLAGMILIYSCEDTIPIVDSGRFTDEFVWQTPNMARGVLFWAYVGLPNYYYNFGIGSEFLEIATDDATTSNSSSVAIQFATGALSPGNNSLDSWSSSYNKIRQINLFLQKGITDQLYNQDTILNRRFYNRFRAEAYVMRAWWYFDLLKNFGGIENGQPMGIPIITKEITDQEALQLKRATYMECVNQIVADCETALKTSDFPEDYVGTDLVTGTNWYGAANKRIARVIKTMTYLYAASPAFNRDNNIALWDSAASNAFAAIKAIDGVPNANALPARDFYTVTNNQDVIWPRPQNSATSFVYEQQNLPPSLRGNGFTNPSQELVNAFYDAEGYPITHSSSKYNPQDPYNGRDSRLKKFILCNGMVYSGHTVETYEGGDDAPGSSLNASKTGYYLLKFLSPNAELYPEAKNGRASFVALFSKTELYLIFAEAMNELAGPDDKRYGLSAREALGKIRKRAGFVADPYMTGIVSNSEFRTLVHNERRVELCFEGKRFWDLRRWNEPVNTNVSRARIRSENGNFVYESPEVIEKKLFNSPFMPLPLNETIIIQGLKQNDGWSN
jgi:starch-binding outer membrane protein, SusD/RagB family